MAEDRQSCDLTRLRRRGILAALGALVTAVAAKATGSTAHAADGGNLILGQNNTSNNTTQITRNGPLSSQYGLFVDNNNYVAILGRAAGSATSSAIYAYALAGPDQALQANATAAGTYGVRSDAVSTAGLFVSQTDYGVAGISFGRTGGYFKSTASDYALRAESTTGFAALFQGGLVRIEGNFEATGTKSAVVPYPDGTERRVYCTEAPEAWFEDFGEARLTAGRAVVPIPADFLPLIDGSRYYVFVQPHDPDTQGLAVTARYPDRFEVIECGKGSSSSSFTFRIVARRKDVVATRLAPAQRPAVQDRSPLRLDPPKPPVIPPPLR